MRHQYVVDVLAVEAELPAQDALDDETARLVQPAGPRIGREHAQRQAAHATGARFGKGGIDEQAPDAAPLRRRVHGEPDNGQDVRVRRDGVGGRRAT